MPKTPLEAKVVDGGEKARIGSDRRGSDVHTDGRSTDPHTGPSKWRTALAIPASDRLSAPRALPAADGDRAPARERRVGFVSATVARLQHLTGKALAPR